MTNDDQDKLRDAPEGAELVEMDPRARELDEVGRRNLEEFRRRNARGRARARDKVISKAASTEST